MSGGGGKKTTNGFVGSLCGQKDVCSFFVLRCWEREVQCQVALGSPVPNRLVKEIPHAASQQQVSIDAAQNRLCKTRHQFCSNQLRANTFIKSAHGEPT